jgi:hypothetical protein
MASVYYGNTMGISRLLDKRTALDPYNVLRIRRNIENRTHPLPECNMLVYNKSNNLASSMFSYPHATKRWTKLCNHSYLGVVRMEKTQVSIRIGMCWDMTNQSESRSLVRVSDEACGCCCSGVKLESGRNATFDATDGGSFYVVFSCCVETRCSETTKSSSDRCFWSFLGDLPCIRSSKP